MTKPVPGKDEKASVGYRLWALIISFICLGILGVAVYVKPSPKGYGTHTQLDLPACGFRERTGYPCPTCGMTTAFSLVVRGRILRAFAVQPAGAVLALACVFTVCIALYSVIWGRKINLEKYFLFYITPDAVFMLIMVIILVSWGWECLLVWLKHSG